MSDQMQGLSDRVVSWLRTVVPGAWAAALTAGLTWVSPHLPGDVLGSLAEVLGGEAATSLVVALALAGWYGFWRRIEPRIPAWAARLLLGSAKTPTYQ